MNLTRERALELHRQMWTDMRSDLGNYPTGGERVEYKKDWCKTHFPNERVLNNCFLCEYSKSCSSCPVKWPTETKGYNYCTENDYYYKAPISELLALPEREEETELEEKETADGLYLCDLAYSAEGECTGYMYLTEQEYETVKKVVSTCNWNNVEDEGYAGRLSIYCAKLEEKIYRKKLEEK